MSPLDEPSASGAEDSTASQNSGSRKPTTASDHARAEWDRERRLVDQMASMQARLRDRYRTAATIMTCSILAASTIGIAFAFAANSGPVTVFGLTAERTTWLGWLAVATFVVTLIDLIVDMRGAARQREDAVNQLAELKSSYYAPIDPADEPLALDRLSERYRATMGSIPAIPERLFNSLKAKHLFKVEVSRLLSEHPGMKHRRAKKAVRDRAKA